MLASSKHPKEAQAFLKFVTGKGGQDVLKNGTSFEYAVGKGAESNPKLVPLVDLQAPKVDPLVRAATRDAVLDAIPAKTEIGGNIACYVPSTDLIRMPAPEAFASAEDWKSSSLGSPAK